ncbi:hypothetical protein [Peribacillus frigoritolerans]|uniref:hypothetical protein n=1 Tax=Peribacillus frigoritolerans TaxID=450367 RepID=UPI002E245A8F|nr:hypothetical protein [Peribacillus frigoritolerans]MED3845794.1 hypothetical protein [Peribacillus frigoritolerans]
MDFATLQSIIQTSLNDDIFKIRAESVGSSQISRVMNLLYNGELLLEQASLTTMENRLIVTGRHTVDILGQSSLHASYEFFLVDDNPQITIGIILPDDWIPERLRAVLDEIFRIFQCTYNISDSGLIISSVSDVIPPLNVSHLPSVPLTIPQGFLIFSSFDGTGPVFDLLESILGRLMPLNLRNLLNTEDFTPGPIEAAVQLNLPALGPISFSNTRFVFQREGLALVNDISLDIGNEILLLKGGGDVQPDSTFNISFGLVGVRKEGQQEVITNEWVDPLGFTGLTIRQFGVRIGVETRGTIFGMFGEVALGQEGDADQIILEVGGEIINGNTPQAMIASIRSGNPSSGGLALTEIIEGLSMIPIGDFPILNEIKVEHFEVYIVLTPEGYRHPVNNVTYYGLSLNTSISLFGLSIRADAQFIPDTGIKAIGELGQFNLGGVLEITDASGERGPTFQIDTTRGSEQDLGYVYLSCKLSLFGLSTTLEAKAEQDHFSLFLDYSVQGLGNFRLNCLLKNEEFHGSSEITFDFGDRTIPISVGGQLIGGVNLGSQTVGSLQLAGHVRGKIEVHLSAQTFQLSLSGNLSALGLPEFSVEITIDESLEDLSNLTEIFYQELVDQAEELIRTPLENPALLLEWTQSGVVNLTREVGDVLNNVYRLSIDEAAKKLNQAQFSSIQAAQILTAHYREGDRLIGSFLDIGGYGAREILEALHSGLGWEVDRAIRELVAGSTDNLNSVVHAIVEVFDWNGDELADTFNRLGYTADKIGNGLRILNWNAERITQQLHQLGRSINEVTNFLKNHMRLNTNDISKLFKNELGLNEIDTTKALKDAFRDVNVIAVAIKEAWDKQISEVTGILKGADFNLNAVAFGTRYLGELELGNDQSRIIEIVSKALALAEYSLEDVVQGIKFTYTLTDERLTSLLLISDFSPGDVAKYAHERLNWGAEKISKVFVQFDVETDSIIEGLKQAEFPDVDIQKANEKIREVLSIGSGSVNLGGIRVRDHRDWF